MRPIQLKIYKRNHQRNNEETFLDFKVIAIVELVLKWINSRPMPIYIILLLKFRIIIKTKDFQRKKMTEKDTTPKLLESDKHHLSV